MNEQPFYGVYLDKAGNAKRLLNGQAVENSQITQMPFNGNFYDVDGSIHNIMDLSGGGGGGMTPAQVQALIDASLEHKDPIIAAVASASTVLFRFSEDGQTFSFLGGTFGWFATHEHYGVVTISAAIDIPFVTGRLVILDVSNPNNPILTTKPLAPSMTFSDNEFAVGNMYREDTVNVVYIYGAGTYKYGETESGVTQEYVDDAVAGAETNAKTYTDEQMATAVKTTGTQSIQGRKTFESRINTHHIRRSDDTTTISHVQGMLGTADFPYFALYTGMGVNGETGNGELVGDTIVPNKKYVDGAIAALYEEADWTPDITTYDGVSPLTKTEDTYGHAVRIGRFVYVEGVITWEGNSGNASSNMYLANLPWPPAKVTEWDYSGASTNKIACGILGINGYMNAFTSGQITDDVRIGITKIKGPPAVPEAANMMAIVNLTWNTMFAGGSFASDGQLQFSGTYMIDPSNMPE